MLFWLLLILVVVLVAGGAAAASRRQTVTALALHERMQRTAPDDELAQLGPNEFEALHTQCRKNRSTRVALSIVLWSFLGLAAAVFMAGAIGELAFLVFPFAGFIGGLIIGRMATPKVEALMLNRLAKER